MGFYEHSPWLELSFEINTSCDEEWFKNTPWAEDSEEDEVRRRKLLGTGVGDVGVVV